MPRVGMEPIRRAALVEATIAEVGEKGSLDVTVARIARRAGVSPALAHHYFGGKEDLFLAAMRAILTQYGMAVRAALAEAEGARERLEAVIRVSFGPQNFTREAVAAWLNFYVHARTLPGARRLLTVYQRRLRANLLHDLRPLLGGEAEDAAETIAALIDGLYIRQALGGAGGGDAAAARVIGLVERRLGESRRV